MKLLAKSSAVWLAGILLAQNFCAQSLGDIARQQREKNKQPATTTNKVLTNEDLSTPGHPDGSASDEARNKKNPRQKTSAKTEQSKEDEEPSAEELRQAIQDKKAAIAEIQGEIAELQSTINHVQNNRNVYTNAPEYNEAQKRKEQEVNRLKGVLEQQQDELKDLQQTARKAGYGSALYD
jgi:uncharacterized protein YukE